MFFRRVCVAISGGLLFLEAGFDLAQACVVATDSRSRTVAREPHPIPPWEFRGEKKLKTALGRL
jgi:hypothetical protein